MKPGAKQNKIIRGSSFYAGLFLAVAMLIAATAFWVKHKIRRTILW